jgi:hypothetical protein
MKKLIRLLCFAGTCLLAQAHDHIETRQVPVPGNPSQLEIIATATNLNPIATYFPPGEKPSTDLFAFPGGTYATLLTFSAFESTSATLGDLFVRADILSVTGPAGGTFSFWEAGQPSSAWTLPVGWTASEVDKPSITVSEDESGYGHLHGRVFTTNKPGTYDVTFQVVPYDPNNPTYTGPYTASASFVVHFTVIDPPQLSISKVDESVRLAFTSRANLSYDVQSSTTLSATGWTTIDTLDGTGGALEFIEPIANRPRVFYRLVEY